MTQMISSLIGRVNHKSSAIHSSISCFKYYSFIHHFRFLHPGIFDNLERPYSLTASLTCKCNNEFAYMETQRTMHIEKSGLLNVTENKYVVEILQPFSSSPLHLCYTNPHWKHLTLLKFKPMIAHQRSRTC